GSQEEWIPACAGMTRWGLRALWVGRARWTREGGEAQVGGQWAGREWTCLRGSGSSSDCAAISIHGVIPAQAGIHSWVLSVGAYGGLGGTCWAAGAGRQRPSGRMDSRLRGNDP